MPGKVEELWELVEQLWSPGAAMRFDGDKDTADMVVITVRPEQAEFWRNEEGHIKTA